MRRLAEQLRRRMAREDGYVMVVVMVLLMIALALGAAALAESLDSKTLNSRQARVSRAQQATDAGIAATLYNQNETNIDNWNLNGGVLGIGSVLDCVVPQINVSGQISGLVNASAALSNAGVCPQGVTTGSTGATGVTGALGNHAYESTEFFPGATNLGNGTTTANGQNGSYEREFFPTIVSLGWDTNGSSDPSRWVYARQEAILAPIAPLQAVEGMNNVTLGGLSLLGIPLAGTLNGNVVARGNLTTPALAEVGLNTTLSNGLFGTLMYSGSYSGGITVANRQHVSASTIVTRPAPIISSTVDCSVAANCTALGSAYNPTNHSFSLTSGSVTFQPGNYYFCSFYAASGATINVNPSSASPVRILIRSPSDPLCAADKASGDPNIGDFNDVAGFTNQLLGTGGVLASSGFQVYVEGDGSYDGNTSVQVGPTSTSGLLSLSALTYGAVIYAPTSAVTVSVPAACVALSLVCTGGIFEGSVVGYNTTVNALTITQDLDLGNYPLYDGIQTFRPLEYIQCSATLTSLTGNLATDTGGC